jgi:Flp pilus assembly protein TadD
MWTSPLSRRGLGLPLLLVAGLALSACSAIPGADPDVAFTSNVQGVTPVGTPPDAEAIKDDLGLGKYHFRARNYGLAEMHFRRAVEATPGNAEGWLGLAASYDQLKRWELADRAYAQAFKITGPSAAFLNNRGYSYLLRGDVRRASEDLSQAAARDPGNERIQNNLKTLDGRARSRRA